MSTFLARLQTLDRICRGRMVSSVRRFVRHLCFGTLLVVCGCDVPLPGPSDDRSHTGSLGETVDPGSTPDDDFVSPAEVEPTPVGSDVEPSPVDVEVLAPRAEAGADREVLAGETVVLDGSGSSRSATGRVLAFQWQQVRGTPIVALTGSTSPMARFVAPLVDADALLLFRLTVRDDGGTASDEVRVVVLAATSPAEAESLQVDAGPDQLVSGGAPVTLTAHITDGDPNDPVGYRWRQTGGPTVSLSDTGSSTATFLAPLPASETELTFEVEATFPSVVVADSVTVLVQPTRLPAPPPAPPPDPPPPECASASDCDDGVFCNGAEACVLGACMAGAAPCAGALCVEASRGCAECTRDADCDDDLFCNGPEVCVSGGCRAGARPCTGQMCDETRGSCAECLVPRDCDDGLFCSGPEVCVAGACRPGVLPCGGQLCDEPRDLCAECLVPADCDDGLFCNGAEWCVNGSCVAGTPPCSATLCDEASGDCLDSLCDRVGPPFLPPVQAGTLLGSVADEASGLVASRRNADVLWTHNDDGGDNRLFAINIDGTLLGTYTLGTGSVDPEDIAIGPGPVAGADYLYWGNIGDNNNVRATVFVKRVIEPVVASIQSPVTVSLTGVDTLTLAYPTDATAPSHKDAETLLVDPWNGDLYVVTKRTAVGMVYRAAYPQSTTATTTLQYVASIPWSGAVGGDVSPDGRLIIIRRYSGNVPAASVWTRPVVGDFWDAFSNPRCDVALAAEPQGEAICWDRQGRGYFTVSENQAVGAQIPIWYFGRAP